MSFRFFNPATQRWAIHWADSRRGVLDPPVVGAFVDGTGTFEGADTFEGRPILVRFVWSRTRTETPRWEQAFSEDGGKSWETNWVMDFARNDPAPQVAHLRDFQAIELRRYKVREGQREAFARYFESFFPEAFQQIGAIAFGQFFERDKSRSIHVDPGIPEHGRPRDFQRGLLLRSALEGAPVHDQRADPRQRRRAAARAARSGARDHGSAGGRSRAGSRRRAGRRRRPDLRGEAGGVPAFAREAEPTFAAYRGRGGAGGRRPGHARCPEQLPAAPGPDGRPLPRVARHPRGRPDAGGSIRPSGGAFRAVAFRQRPSARRPGARAFSTRPPDRACAGCRNAFGMLPAMQALAVLLLVASPLFGQAAAPAPAVPSKVAPLRGRHAVDDGSRQHVHRSGRVDGHRPRARDDPGGSGRGFLDRARGRRRERRGRRAGRRVGRVQAGREVAAQGRQRPARQERLVEAARVRIPDVAEREARRDGDRARSGRRLDRGPGRHEPGRWRKTRRPGRSRLRSHAPEGLRARILRGQEGEPPRRGPPREIEGVRRDRTPGARRSGRRPGDHPGRQARFRRRSRRAGPRQAHARGCRHALHDRLEHEGAHDAAARPPGRRGPVDVGHAGHEPPSVVQARRRGDDEAGARPAVDLRLHGAAAPGPGMAVRVPGRHPRQGARHARDDAADEQVRRALPVLEPDGRRRRLHGGPRALSRHGARRRLRQGHADARCSTPSA